MKQMTLCAGYSADLAKGLSSLCEAKLVGAYLNGGWCGGCVDLLQVLQDATSFYLVMEYCNGETGAARAAQAATASRTAVCQQLFQGLCLCLRCPAAICAAAGLASAGQQSCAGAAPGHWSPQHIGVSAAGVQHTRQSLTRCALMWCFFLRQVVRSLTRSFAAVICQRRLQLKRQDSCSASWHMRTKSTSSTGSSKRLRHSAQAASARQLSYISYCQDTEQCPNLAGLQLTRSSDNQPTI